MKRAMMIIMAMLVAAGVLQGEAAAQAPPIPAGEQLEVLTRGPINEAFAQPVNLESRSYMIAPTAPPTDIEEIPPPDRPVGHEFAWVPGYWAWDSERNGYIWVSGCWRAVPPGMSWMPGYWAKASRGWQWVPGFWVPVGNTEIEYLPAPPALTNLEPSHPAPSPDYIWVPACWYWHHGQYIQRPGYWIVAQADWVWVPSHYVWTPRGYVFANGHWDYTLSRRGVLFAPVYFPGHTSRHPRISFSLNIVVEMDYLVFGLFTRPQYSHYYFGDYYDRSYIRIGIFPWFEVTQRNTWYDPIYNHYRWRHTKREPRWEQQQRQEYDRRRADKTQRPPRTYREMESRVSNMPESQRRNFEVAAPITRIVASKKTPFKFEQTKPAARQRILRHAEDVHKFVAERSQWESQSAGRVTDRTRVQQAPTTDSKKITSPVQRQGTTSKQPTQIESVPEARTGAGAPPVRRREGTTLSAEQQRPAEVSSQESQQYQTDKVKVRIRPVVSQQSSGFFRKGAPSRPTEEQHEQKRK